MRRNSSMIAGFEGLLAATANIVGKMLDQVILIFINTSLNELLMEPAIVRSEPVNAQMTPEGVSAIVEE